jgi:hypothetical protein
MERSLFYLEREAEGGGSEEIADFMAVTEVPGTFYVASL